MSAADDFHRRVADIPSKAAHGDRSVDVDCDGAGIDAVLAGFNLAPFVDELGLDAAVGGEVDNAAGGYVEAFPYFAGVEHRYGESGYFQPRPLALRTFRVFRQTDASVGLGELVWPGKAVVAPVESDTGYERIAVAADS